MASSPVIKRRNLANFGYALFICELACVLLFSYVQIVCGAHALTLRSGSHLLQADFVRLYTCGKMAQSQDSHRVYEDQVQLKWLNKVISPEKVDEPPFIQYPPIAFLLFLPIACLPPLLAYNLWNFVTVALGIFALWRLIPINSKIKSKPAVIMMIVAAVSSEASFSAVRAGQVNWFQLFATALFWVFWFDKRDLAAGIAAAFTILKPQYSFICLLPALATGRWRIVAAAAVTVFVLLAAAAAVIGPQNILGYPQVLWRIEGNAQDLCVLARSMYCLRMLLSWMMPLDWAFKISLLLWSASAALIFFAWRALPPENCYRQRVMASLTVLWALFFSPHAHCYDMLLLVLPAVLTLPCLSPYRALGLKPLCLKLWTLAFLSYPVIGWAFFIVTFNPKISWDYFVCFGNVLFTLFLLIAGWPMFARAIFGRRSVLTRSATLKSADD